MIVGAGAIGGTVGAVLARAGIPTVLVARGRHAETLAAEGLTLRTPDGTFHTPVAAVSQAEQLRLTPHDVLIFTTKTQQLDAALQEWVDQPVHGSGGVVGTAGELLPVMTALNGVAAEEKALRYFRSVFGICVWLPAVHLEPGEVIVRSWPVVGQFHIGRWPAPLRTPADAELLQGLTETWIVAGIRVRAVDDVAPWKYNKLLSNLGNAVGALSAEGADVGQVVAAVRDEGEQVLRHAGIEFVSFEVSTAARADGPTPRPVPGRTPEQATPPGSRCPATPAMWRPTTSTARLSGSLTGTGSPRPSTPRWPARRVRRCAMGLGRAVIRRRNSTELLGIR